MKDGQFKIEFIDQATFDGHLFNRDWGKIPEDKQIKSITFMFGGKAVKLENYEQYNITFEQHVTFNKTFVDNITLAGRGENSSDVIVYDCRRGGVRKNNVQKYHEYKWVSPTWKTGIKGGTPRSYHN